MYDILIFNLKIAKITRKHIVHFIIELFNIFLENFKTTVIIMIIEDIFAPSRNFSTCMLPGTNFR
ncbi:hypothetical protein ER70_03765 [Borreliella bissettiae]|uniref:Uncharacterized protein n=1 Tax=Borrelia bissettiae TaxID=64897 RepID=A0A1L8ZBX9_BORBI|nr:hypothetical protein ER70_03765 [Borreliella bissettiae]